MCEPLVNERVVDSEVRHDQLYTVEQLLILLGTAHRVDLLRGAAHHDEAGHIPTSWRQDGYVKAFDFSFLLKTSPVLHRVAVDTDGLLLPPGNRLSENCASSGLSHGSFPLYLIPRYPNG